MDRPFPGGKTGGGTILSFKPKVRSGDVGHGAPEQFPRVRAERTTARFEFKAAGKDQTLVRLTQTGWKQGEEWDKAYDYLADGNAQLLETRRRRFVSGPLDWAKEWGIRNSYGPSSIERVGNLDSDAFRVRSRRPVGIRCCSAKCG